MSLEGYGNIDGWWTIAKHMKIANVCIENWYCNISPLLLPVPSTQAIFFTTSRRHIGILSYLPSCTHPLQWRHNERDGISNHQPQDCLLNRLFRRWSKRTSKLRVTGLCEGNSALTGEFPSQRASNAENVSIWWRHRDLRTQPLSAYNLTTPPLPPPPCHSSVFMDSTCVSGYATHFPVLFTRCVITPSYRPRWHPGRGTRW